jgi:hypothetical protein
MKWISVAERLPTNDDKVLISDGRSIEFGHLGSTGWNIHFKIGDCIEYNGKLTHWMPLPEAPEKDYAIGI